MRLLVKIPLILFALVVLFLFVTIVLPAIHFSAVWTDRAVYPVGEPVTVYWRDASILFTHCESDVGLYKSEARGWSLLTAGWSERLGCIDSNYNPEATESWSRYACLLTWGGARNGSATFAGFYQYNGKVQSCWDSWEEKYVYEEMDSWETKPLPAGRYQAQYRGASTNFEIR